MEQWQNAGEYFRSFGAPESRVLEAAYNAIKPGQSFRIEVTTEVAYAAETGGDTAKRVYHGTSLAAATLIMRGGFIGCALLEALYCLSFLASLFFFLFLPLFLSLVPKHKITPPIRSRQFGSPAR